MIWLVEFLTELEDDVAGAAAWYGKGNLYAPLVALRLVSISASKNPTVQVRGL